MPSLIPTETTQPPRSRWPGGGGEDSSWWVGGSAPDSPASSSGCRKLSPATCSGGGPTLSLVPGPLHTGDLCSRGKPTVREFQVQGSLMPVSSGSSGPNSCGSSNPQTCTDSSHRQGQGQLSHFREEVTPGEQRSTLVGSPEPPICTVPGSLAKSASRCEEQTLLGPPGRCWTALYADDAWAFSGAPSRGSWGWAGLATWKDLMKVHSETGCPPHGSAA